ncbi:hypothetical protein A9R05_44225 (plasmid) [Burkholderia sp. KK1]|uniref:Uncharacterized protein n=1 Tax=Burkholderia sp. M701 TaxID=326454 RepID=V5YNM7_9BURK|nr:hypothetical protein [Burkholderia sp. M701]AQH05963.1 hypothetical protein A9R05_44225 [Burkholderia sp. KK1]BAO19195.1 hypothetical protein [Burkholderia sp. M701]
MKSNVIELRHALRNLIGATANARTNKALQAREVAYAAYRNSFSEEERDRVVKLAQSHQQSAPVGHFLHDEDPITTYEDALRIFGNSLIVEALGEAA